MSRTPLSQALLRRRVLLVFPILIATAAAGQSPLQPRPTRDVGADGTVTISGLNVPPSRYASPETNQKLHPALADGSQRTAPRTIVERRRLYDALNDGIAAHMKTLFRVSVRKSQIGGVPVEIVESTDGPAPRNRHKVLVNLHGGAFMWGSGGGGEVEAIPIAAVARITVVTVDYRLAPEFTFPAASEDVAAVYRALLKTHHPSAIGIYGCSAGGILTAEAIAWFDKTGLPMPGAVGTFCGSASQFSGDSMNIAPSVTGENRTEGDEMRQPYFAAESATNPLVFPINSERVMRRFPPTLLIAGSRDYSLSSLFYTQRVLTRLGVEAELHVWDGLPHAFLVNPDLPESREAYSVVAQFFNRHLVDDRSSAPVRRTARNR